jgi:hypothetical protein
VIPATLQRLARLALSVCPVALVAGCPIDAAQFDGPGVPAGMYWVEHDDGELVLFELPAERSAEGTWFTFETDPPEWYAGPALYELHDDGTWSRLSGDQTLTLDEIIQLYDPRPALPEL